jgi:hypothetical protein
MERTFPSMGEHDDDRVHSGGIPTTTVLRAVLSAIVERSRSRSSKYRSTCMASPIKSNQGESQVEQEHATLSYLSIDSVIYPYMIIVTLGTTI